MEIMMHSVPNLVPSGGAASLEMRGQGSAAAANLALETDAFDRIRELEAALRARDEFLAVLAHELRNPLAPISSAAQLVRALADSDERLMKAGDILERQVAHLSRLVDDLVDTARITWGRLTLETEAVNIASILVGALETMQPQFAARRHAVAVKLLHEDLPVQADPTRLAQVFCNLLGNAAKYTPDGGAIEVEAKRDGNDAVICIADTGVGIPSLMLSAIFDLFTQVTPAADRSAGGLGLGLPIVRKLVEMHHGTVQAKSDGPGRGSQFVVRLPLAQAAADTQPIRAMAPQRRMQSILVVDDDTDTCDALAMMLQMLGHEISVAHDGKGALDAAARIRPDVILLDIGLPEVDGYEIARHLRKCLEFSSVRLVALTGYGGAEHRSRAMQAGFDAYLVKPIDFDTLADLLH